MRTAGTRRVKRQAPRALEAAKKKEKKRLRTPFDVLSEVDVDCAKTDQETKDTLAKVRKD